MQQKPHGREISWKCNFQENIYYSLFDFGSISIERELDFLMRPFWRVTMRSKEGEVLMQSGLIRNLFNAQAIGEGFLYKHKKQKQLLTKAPIKANVAPRKRVVMVKSSESRRSRY
jgi:hypothetical protein